MWRISIEKFMASGAEYWTNIYYNNNATLADAVIRAGELVAAERPLYGPQVTVTKARVDDFTEGTDVGQTIVYNLPGTRTADLSGSYLPLFVTARVDFGAADAGRPSRKYLRGTLTEDDLLGPLSLSAASIARLQTYADAITDGSSCDVDGADLTTGVPWPAPQMRQLRRGKKRTVTP